MTAAALVGMVTAVPMSHGAVALYDGRSLWEDDGAPTDGYPHTILWTRNTGDVVRRIAQRPLARWRYWHRRGQLVRAARAPRQLVRDYTGLYDVSTDRRIAWEQRELLAPWDALTRIREWTAARGYAFKTTAGALGVELLTRHFPPNFPPLWSNLQEEQQLHAAIYGGRAEVFWDHADEAGTIYGRIIYYDANGAYCDVLRSIPLPYPYHYIAHPNLKAAGITDATVDECQSGFPVLPTREHGYHAGEKRGVWYNDELRYALDCGARLLRVHGGVQFARRTEALRPLGDYLARARDDEADPVIRALLKKIPNALIGRFASPPSVCVTREGTDWRRDGLALSALRVTDRVWSVELPLRRRSPWYAAAWSAAILAAQRVRLHQAMTSHVAAGRRVLYVDTDGMMLSIPGGQRKPPETRAVGGYKIEWQADAVTIQGVKSFRARTIWGETVSRHAGRKDVPSCPGPTEA